MITSKKAAEIVASQSRDYGVETVPYDVAVGRVLAEDLVADRDLPPFDRSTMDGIAIKYVDFARGQRAYRVVAVLAAGSSPDFQLKAGECVQIMTGAAVPDSADVIVPIEEVTLGREVATVNAESVSKNQFIHLRGNDAGAGEIIVRTRQIITPNVIPVAASVGKTQLVVARGPRIVVISTGDELVDVAAQPTPYQIRRSNRYAIQAALLPYQTATLHVDDDPVLLREQLTTSLDEYDVVIMSGGVSKGKFDYIPTVLEDLSVEVLFHGVKQKPGKPLLFGVRGDTVVFALPGNPVSTTMCTHKYVLPWLRASLGLHVSDIYAILDNDVAFEPDLDYFLQVKLTISEEGELRARPIKHNGSGDYTSLAEANGFIELPRGKIHYNQGEVYRVIPIGLQYVHG